MTTQEIRNLLRTRKQFVRERSSHVQRIQKTLEDANIKLDSVITDIVGRSGRRMIEALIAGETDPAALAALAHRRIKASPAELEAALRGRVTDHHRFMLGLLLQHIDAIDAAITRIDQEVDGKLEPFRTAIQIVSTIPGVRELSAEVIVAEIGVDMARFPTAAHLISWSGLCPKERRKRRQAPVYAHAQGSALAENYPHPMCFGRGPYQGQLSPGAVSSPARPAQGKKGDWCRRRFDPDGGPSPV